MYFVFFFLFAPVDMLVTWATIVRSEYHGDSCILTYQVYWRSYYHFYALCLATNCQRGNLNSIRPPCGGYRDLHLYIIKTTYGRHDIMRVLVLLLLGCRRDSMIAASGN